LGKNKIETTAELHGEYVALGMLEGVKAAASQEAVGDTL
jgi:hypothetical protein